MSAWTRFRRIMKKITTATAATSAIDPMTIRAIAQAGSADFSPLDGGAREVAQCKRHTVYVNT